MTQLYYFEERDFAGRWQPKTSPLKPIIAKPEGGNRAIQGICLIAEDHQHLTLNQLYDTYSPDGFVSTFKDKPPRSIDIVAEHLTHCQNIGMTPSEVCLSVLEVEVPDASWAEAFTVLYDQLIDHGRVLEFTSVRGVA